MLRVNRYVEELARSLTPRYLRLRFRSARNPAPVFLRFANYKAHKDRIYGVDVVLVVVP